MFDGERFVKFAIFI